MDEAAGTVERIRIWDLPVRVVHWLLVILIPFQWWTAKEDRLDLHIVGGTLILGLLLFRLLWGLVGSSTARFSTFVRGPRQIISYLRGRTTPMIGHNPVGAVSAIAMIAVLSVQVGLGLFASDEDGLEGGPLSHLVSFETADTLSDRHETLFDVLLILIALHVAAILFYAIKRNNLVGPMISGSGPAEGRAGMTAAPLWRFWVVTAVAGAITYWLWSGVPLP